jgi:ferrous iron transport protein A
VSPEGILPLEFVPTGNWAEVEEVSGEQTWVGRMAELGLRVGCRLQVIRQGSPCLLRLEGCRLSLRRDAGRQIFVRPVAAFS